MNIDKIETTKITVTYNRIVSRGLQITPEEIARKKKAVERAMFENFGWDEDYLDVEVEVIEK